MKIASNKKGENSFNMKTKAPFRRPNNGSKWSNKPNKQNFKGSKNGHQILNNKAWQLGKNSIQPNTPKKFVGKDAEIIKSMLKEHIDNDPNNDEDSSETSESDDVDATNSESDGEEEFELLVNSDEIETSSKEVEKGNVVEQHNDSINQKVESPHLGYIRDPKARMERDERTISVKNLSGSIKKIHLQKFFGKYGVIKEIALSVYQTASEKLARAFILFEKEEDAEIALETQGMKYKGKWLLVGKRRHKQDVEPTVYLNWNQYVDMHSFVCMLETFGVVKYIRFSPDKRHVYVQFESADSVELALAAGTVTVGTHQLHFNTTKYSPIQSKQHGDISGKRAQSIQPQQYQENSQPSIQIHKNNDDDSVTITFNNSGYQGSNFAMKNPHTVRTGFVQKRR